MAVSNIPKKRWNQLEKEIIKSIQKEAKADYFGKYIELIMRAING